jgi:hypothetical protein
LTLYPPHYLQQIESLLLNNNSSIVAVIALPSAGKPESLSEKLLRRFYVELSRVLPRQVFAGGYAQTISCSALQQVGGYSEKYWNYVLMDHEIMHRIFRVGSSIYHVDLWCCSSSRRRNRNCVSWNLTERVLYLLTPYSLKDWFFYTFLAQRFERRQLHSKNLREKTWEKI